MCVCVCFRILFLTLFDIFVYFMPGQTYKGTEDYFLLLAKGREGMEKE